jgi:DNA topoisomerase-1
MAKVAVTGERIAEFYEDVEWCASAAGLRYADLDEPGVRRLRRGKGFSYRGPNGRPISPADRERIRALVIPPAWQKVWICSDPRGHIQAIGEDDRGRRQYLYHESWRGVRDLLNFYRLIGVGAQLPAIRADVDRQLRRRTFDRDLVLAAMIRIVDCCGLRAGSEEYAEENDSFGLSTLNRRHVAVRGSKVEFCFPAKSGQQAVAALDDARVARVVGRLVEQRGRRLWRVDGQVLSADDVNGRLDDLTGSVVSLKDFRTWRGTTTAFGHLRRTLDSDDREAEALAAIDAAAEALGNTRAVARAHYVHPHLIESYVNGELDRFLATWRRRGRQHLDTDEVALLGFLDSSLRRWDDYLEAAVEATG